MNAALSGGLSLRAGAGSVQTAPLVLAGFSALGPVPPLSRSGPSYLFTRRRRLINRLISNTIHPGR